MPTMTPEERVALVKRVATSLKQISKWPWHYNGYSTIFNSMPNPDDNDPICDVTDWRESGHGDQLRGPRMKEAISNAEFIAQAPTDFAALLDMLVDAEARADRAEWYGYHGHHPDPTYCADCQHMGVIHPCHDWTESQWRAAVRARYGMEG